MRVTPVLVQCERPVGGWFHRQRLQAYSSRVLGFRQTVLNYVLGGRSFASRPTKGDFCALRTLGHRFTRRLPQSNLWK